MAGSGPARGQSVLTYVIIGVIAVGVGLAIRSRWLAQDEAPQDASSVPVTAAPTPIPPQNVPMEPSSEVRDEAAKREIVAMPHAADFYPDSAKRAGEEGRVVVRICANAEGIVQTANVTSTSGFPDLDDAALRYARSVRVRGRNASGGTVPTCVGLPIKFALNATPRLTSMPVSPR